MTRVNGLITYRVSFGRRLYQIIQAFLGRTIQLQELALVTL